MGSVAILHGESFDIILYAPEAYAMQEKFVRLDTVEGKLQAEILRGMLQAQGIETMLSQESAASIYGFGVGHMAEVEILVRQDQYDQAQSLLEAYNAGTLEQDDELDQDMDPS
jgi:hypothetical protein